MNRDNYYIIISISFLRQRRNLSVAEQSSYSVKNRPTTTKVIERSETNCLASTPEGDAPGSLSIYLAVTDRREPSLQRSRIHDLGGGKLERPHGRPGAILNLCDRDRRGGVVPVVRLAGQVVAKRKGYRQNESPIVKTKAEQSFCYAPTEESGCIFNLWNFAVDQCYREQ